jgi:RHS repeat-associated protein
MQMSIDQNTNRITLIGSTSPEYDSAGNLTKDDQWQYVYDAENRIVEVKTLAGATIATYSYDWRGVRIKKVTGESTTRYVFSGLKALAEYTNGALTREYIYHGDRFLGEWASQTVHMLYGDQISPRLSADSIGTQKGEQGHFPFGETWYESGYVTKWKFTYHERDAESGLDYATFRYYSSRLGRFMTPDPLAGNIFNPQRLNRYAYVLNDPVNLTDPYGLECTGPGGIILPCPDVTSITVNGSTYSSLGAFFEGIISAKLRPRNVDGVRGGTGPGGPPEIGPPRQNPQTCVEPNVLQRAVITGLGFWAGLTGRTIGVGAGGSAGIGYVMGNAFSASRQLVVSPNGQAAFVTTVGTNAIPLGPTHGAGAFGGLQVSVSNAQNPGQLAGVSVNGGGGGGSGAGAAVDVSFGTTGTWQANATLGAGAGGYGAAGTFQVSSVTSICPPR